MLYAIVSGLRDGTDFSYGTTDSHSKWSVLPIGEYYSGSYDSAISFDWHLPGVVLRKYPSDRVVSTETPVFMLTCNYMVRMYAIGEGKPPWYGKLDPEAPTEFPYTYDIFRTRFSFKTGYSRDRHEDYTYVTPIGAAVEDVTQEVSPVAVYDRDENNKQSVFIRTDDQSFLYITLQGLYRLPINPDMDFLTKLGVEIYIYAPDPLTYTKPYIDRIRFDVISDTFRLSVLSLSEGW